MSEQTEAIVIAYCGLICSDCGAYKKNRCKGCHSEKPMNRNCKIKKCNIENNYVTCADCKEFDDLKKCRKLNNVISKVFSFIFRTNRIRNLNSIREVGIDQFKAEKS